MMQQQLMKLGIPTYTDTYFTLLPSTATSQIKIGQDMPTPVGWIYGISTTINGSHPTDPTKPMINRADSTNLYVYFKIATDLFMNNYRLDNYVMFDANPTATANTNSQLNNSQRYMSVNIPSATDLKESYYLNPQGIVDKYIGLTIHYISLIDYRMMQKKGLITPLGTFPDWKGHAQQLPHQHH